jgi:hypothetical protein
MIEGPKRDKQASGIRAIIEAVAQFTPLSAALARLYQTTFPSREAIDIERWEDEVTQALNNKLEGQLIRFGRIDLDGSTYRFARSSNVSSLTDEGLGSLRLNFLEPVAEPYIVDFQADQGVATEIKKSPEGFSLQIRDEKGPVDSGFVFIVRAFPK